MYPRGIGITKRAFHHLAVMSISRPPVNECAMLEKSRLLVRNADSEHRLRCFKQPFERESQATEMLIDSDSVASSKTAAPFF
jgi:hypothetical protein